ncbi:MAG: tetratricopeptide repeat-containing sulfotransferase family protein, partial [Steroidobacteraceae bacterium]
GILGPCMHADADNPSGGPADAALDPVRRLRLEGNCLAALAALRELEQSHLESGVLWQERALCHRDHGDAAQAMLAFQRAVQLNDALPESWVALIGAYRAAGRTAEAAHAGVCLAKLQSLPMPVLRGSSLLNEGHPELAEPIVREFLQRQGLHIDGMRLLAQIATRREVLDDAELLLEKVVELAPEYHDARCELATVLMLRRRHLPALMHARHLLVVDPRNPAWRLLYASACDGLGEFAEALRLYRELLAEAPGDASLQLKIAHALRNLGQAGDAAEAFGVATHLEAVAGAAYLGLANIMSHRFRDDDLAHMRELEAAADTAAAQRYQLCFALGKALEDRREYEESFHYYARGNALKRSELFYRPEAAEDSMRRQASVCDAGLFASRRGAGCSRPDPIFIIGLPRAGSTLLEQILASHSLVDGTLELPEIPRLVQQFRTRSQDAPPRYPAILRELRADELRRMGEIYLEETGAYRRGAPFFIDKMPGNFHDVGFIHLILPNAKFIDARRDALACCFGNFKQLFVNGQKFTYDLAEMGRYYRNYVGLMNHWIETLPGAILQVRHEDVVLDFEPTVRRILDFCGLPFEAACLEFHKTERSVRTLSSDQVRRPIYREGLEQWRNYERWLGPLKDALGPLAESTAFSGPS